MPWNDHVGRIPKNAFMVNLIDDTALDPRSDSLQAASLTMFIMSFGLCLTRSLIRLQYQRRLFVDDVFLFIALLLLCVAMALMIYFSSSMYMVEALLIDPSTAEIPVDFIAQSTRVHRLSSVYLDLT